MKKHYIAPQITLVSFRAERGYVASSLVEKANNLAESINNEIDVHTPWEDGQELYGFNTTGDPNDGLAAGYFYEENTSSWF